VQRTAATHARDAVSALFAVVRLALLGNWIKQVPKLDAVAPPASVTLAQPTRVLASSLGFGRDDQLVD